jgi:hypothetical protein
MLRKKHLSGRALRQLMSFTSTYLCETELSNYRATKTKYRNRPNAAPDLRIQLSSIKKKEKKEIGKYVEY